MQRRKISITHYLDKRLKSLNINGEEKHPLYVRVSYNRKNTKFKSNINLDDKFIESKKATYLSDKELNDFINPNSIEHLKFKEEEKDIRLILNFINDFEIRDFSLKGLSHIMASYYSLKLEIISRGMEILFKGLLSDFGYNDLIEIINWDYNINKIFNVLIKIVDRKSKLYELVTYLGGLDIKLFEVFNVSWSYYQFASNKVKEDTIAGLNKRLIEEIPDLAKLNKNTQIRLVKLVDSLFKVFIRNIHPMLS